MKEAMFYKHGQKNEVVCGLCNHHCYMSPDVTRHLATVLDGINIDIKVK